MLLDVLGLVGDHADERVELDDRHTQVDQVDAVAQQGAQRREKVCRWKQLERRCSSVSDTAAVESLITNFNEFIRRAKDFHLHPAAPARWQILKSMKCFVVL